MTAFEQYLISIGYKRYRNGKEVTDIKQYGFSTMEPGGCTYEYLKDGATYIVFGLNEYKKPPTFCGPRKNILGQRFNDGELTEDDIINQLLKKHSPEEFYKMIQ